MHKLVMPELELRVLDKFNECDEKTPRMWSVDDEAFQQDTCDLLLDGLGVRLGKQVEQSAAEVMCVTVGIAQLVGHGIQKQISTCIQSIMSIIRALTKNLPLFSCSLM